MKPHLPHMPAPEFVGSSRGPMGDAIAELDHSVGRVMEAVRRSGCQEDAGRIRQRQRPLDPV